MRHSVLCKWLIPLSVIVVSCAQENEIEQFETRDLVILASQESAGAEDPETKTVLVDGVNVHWTASDKILVFSGSQSAAFSSSNTEPAATADFTGSISIPSSSASDPYIRALYPYNSNATLAGGSITTTLPSSQTAVAGTFDDDLIVLASRATVSDPGSGSTVTVPMVFDHLCTGIKIRLTKNDVTKVVLTALGGEALAGKFSFNWNNSGVPVVSSVINPTSTITLNPPSGQSAFTPGVWYYIVTLPVTEFTDGVKFTLTNSSNQTAERLLGQVTHFSLGRGTFKSATDLDDGLTFTQTGGGPDDPDVEVQVAGPDTWVATDELGRELPTEIAGKRSNGKVLMFYSPWHTGQHGDYTGGIVNITGVQNTLNKLFFDASDFVEGYWGSRLGYDPCFWGEPLFGYYRSTDEWVLRKHAEMLADAGVDAVFFDCTNGEFLWLDAVKVLLETWSAAKSDGVNVPKIGFVLNLFPESAIDTKRALYMLYYGIPSPLTHENDKNCSLKGFYGRGEYSDLWFRLEGDSKPLIMAYPGCLDLSDPSDAAIFNFFTWRPGQPDYVYGDSPYSFNGQQYHQWGWLQDYPQKVFNGGEQMTVGVAQNASNYSQGHAYAFNSSGTYGRSYTKAHGNDNLVERTPGTSGNGSYIYGYNFQEQWDYALEKNPQHVMVTQWNEWNAARTDWPGTDLDGDGINDWDGFPNAFPDQFDAERSRDIEPTCNWGDHGDNYYYQLVKNVRLFKGAGAYPNVTRPRTMEIDGNFSGWDEVSPDFKHYPGNTFHRNHPWQSIYGITNPGTFSYVNNTGRNDFVDARVTRDDDYVYFYIETKDAITSRTGANWMRLLINIDRDIETGWKGYDYCLNYLNPTSDSKGIVSHATGTSWEWENDSDDTFDYAVSGNKMEIRVPRSVLGLSSDSKLDFEFKWADNNLVETAAIKRILNLYVDGDAAPGGRFNFHYREP